MLLRKRRIVWTIASFYYYVTAACGDPWTNPWDLLFLPSVSKQAWCRLLGGFNRRKDQPHGRLCIWTWDRGIVLCGGPPLFLFLLLYKTVNNNYRIRTKLNKFAKQVVFLVFHLLVFVFIRDVQDLSTILWAIRDYSVTCEWVRRVKIWEINSIFVLLLCIYR